MIKKISKYDSCKSVKSTPIDILKALESIKDGTHSIQVGIARNVFNDKEKYTIEKQKLPAFCFNGLFSTRSNSNLIKSSGFATIDFDHIDDLESTRKLIDSDGYTFSSFISPGNDGLKVLVKIPPVSNDADYKSFYSEIQKHYNKYFETDPSTKDISRLTFVSFDKDLYINPDSEMFTDRFIPKIIVREVVNVPIEDRDEVVKNIITWFNKKWTTGDNRNNNLFILSSAFNNYGVDKYTALDYCNNYISKDFTENEISKLVDSAYRNTENFNTQSFEDAKKVTRIKKMVSAGAKIENIQAKYGETEGVKAEFDKIYKEIDTNVFWYSDKNDNLKVSPIRYSKYLADKGISKYFPFKENKDFQFIVKDDNFVDWIDETRIKDIVLNDLKGRGEFEMWDNLANNTTYFKPDHLSMIDTSTVEPKKDTKTESFLYYKNFAVRTTKDGSDLLKYEDIEEIIWRKQIIDRDIELNDSSDGVFKRFVWLLSGQDADRYNTLRSVIGYLAHSHQDPSSAKAIIFNDEMISDGISNGGAGKGLLHKAIGKIKNIARENGKSWDSNGQFAYQLVNKDTQLFQIDDAHKHFDFENLFSIVTEGFLVQHKNKQSFQIEIEESPKISITTNYVIEGSGASFNRRVFEVEIANYFSDVHSPEDEFGATFFSSWSKEEWAKFDNYLLRSIKFYLKNGLMKSSNVNLEFKKFKKTVGGEFIEWMESKSFDGSPICKKELRDDFSKENPNLARYNSAQKFSSRLKTYCKYNKIKLDEKRYNGAYCYYIGQPLGEINIENSDLEF
jgi:hypothetical protein